MGGAGLGGCPDGRRRKVREGEGKEGTVERPRCGGIVLGGDVEGEVDEGLTMGFDEGGEAGFVVVSLVFI
jgi:hypothetical protein